MKKTGSLIIALLFLLFSLDGVTAISSKSNNTKQEKLGDCYYDSEIVAFIPSGDASLNVGYLDNDEANSGPQGFIVDSYGVHILDTINNRILVTNNRSIEEVLLNDCRYPILFTHVDEGYYVIDQYISSLIKINNQGKTLETILLPDKIEIDDIAEIRAVDNEVRLRTYSNEVYLLSKDSNEWVKLYSITTYGNFLEEKSIAFQDHSISFSSKPNTSFGYIAHTNDYLYVGVYEFVPYLPVVECELTVRKMNYNGDMIGCAVFDFSESYSIPVSFCYVDDGGCLFAMICRKEGVYITKPNLRADYYSNMDLLEAKAEEIYENLPSSTKLGTSFTSKTRNQVETRALDAKTHTWTIVSGNLNTYNSSTTPHCFNQLGIGDSFTGIPYCYGHYYEELSDFDQAQQAGKITGNIASNNGQNDSHFTGSDCSGYVCYAYGLSTKYTTEGLINKGFYVNGEDGNNTYNHISPCSTSNLKPMDFMIKYTSPGASSNHVVLYYSFDGFYFNAYECTKKENADMTVNKNRLASQYDGYVLKTPYYCGGLNNCLPKSTYSYGTYTHWHYCKYNCGTKFNVEQHTWVPYNSGYRCSVCHKYVTQIPMRLYHTSEGNIIE